MTPPAYAALQSPIANALQSVFTTGSPVYGGISSAGGPFLSSAATTPYTYAAPLSSNENSLLSSIMSGYGMTGGQGATLGSANNYVNSVLSPNYLSSITQSPAVQRAITAAVNPMVTAFQNTTMPQLQGQYVANGQVLNGPQVAANQAANGQGSSAFDKAAANAETGLQQSIAATTAGIEDNAYNEGIAQQTAAGNLAPTVSSTELNNLTSALQAESLPRLVQQYGMDEGLQEFNNRVNTMLQALGLGASVSGPDVANESYGTSSSSFQSVPYQTSLVSQTGGLGGLSDLGMTALKM